MSKATGVTLMMPHAKLCEQHAKACIQAAHRIDSAEDREMLLRIAQQWMQDAKSGAELSQTHAHPTGAPRLRTRSL
jgi:hypothetical protein